MSNATVDYRNIYGTTETNGLVDGPAYHEVERETYDWTTRGIKITRLRLLTDPACPFYDVSYCHGELDGKPIIVTLPFDQLPRKNTLAYIIDEAKKDRVYAKAIGILNQGNWSILK